MERPPGGTTQAAGQDLRKEEGKMPHSHLRDALQLLHVHLLFNEERGIRLSSALSSIREKLDVSPRLALGEALRLGLVEEYTDFLCCTCIRRGPRSGEALRRICDGEPPTRESLLAEDRAWERYLAARDARLEAIREAARPREGNTASSPLAWMP